jgi:hypothetical protein
MLFVCLFIASQPIRSQGRQVVNALTLNSPKQVVDSANRIEAAHRLGGGLWRNLRTWAQ